MAASVQSTTLTISTRLKTVYTIFISLGLIAFAVCLTLDPKRAWHSYLLGFFYFVSLALGGLFFTAIQHAVKAGWSVNVRRIFESFTSFLPWAVVFALVFLVGAPYLYDWLDSAKVAQDHLLQHKAPYLNFTFLVIRIVLFFGMWIFFAKAIVGHSLKQDQDGDEAHTIKSVPLSVAFILLFALSYSLFAVDSLMSLQPHWFSTIFGIYAFAGLFQSFLAATILVVLYLRKKGVLSSYVNENHLHDLGKFLFAFTVFWAYIAFSQYMLIWYANLPEETIFFIPRTQGGWLYVSIALILFRFIVPFMALLPKWAKRTPAHLAAVSVLVLVMQYVDLYWLIFPNFNSETPVFSVWEVGIFLGFAGAFMAAVAQFLSRNSVIPVKDPRVHESLHHEVIY